MFYRTNRSKPAFYCRFAWWHAGCGRTAMRRLFWIATACFVFIGFETAAASNTLVEMPLEFREGLLWLKVESSNGKRPLNFLFDTGSAVTVISRSAARELGWKSQKQAAVQGVHAKMTGYWHEQLNLRCGEVTLPRRCLELDLAKLSSSCTCAVDGLVGADFLDDKIVQIDFIHQKLRLLRIAPRDQTMLPLRRMPGGILVPIAVNGANEKWTRLDTGCASALQWVSKGDLFAKPNQRVAIGLTYIQIGETKMNVNLGGDTFSDVLVGLHQKSIFPGEAGLLGNELLSKYATVTISAADRAIWLRKRTVEP